MSAVRAPQGESGWGSSRERRTGDSDARTCAAQTAFLAPAAGSNSSGICCVGIPALLSFAFSFLQPVGVSHCLLDDPVYPPIVRTASTGAAAVWRSLEAPD